MALMKQNCIHKLTSEEVFPFTWLGDRPLDYHLEGPYKMKL
jgi:hypothetical protein